MDAWINLALNVVLVALLAAGLVQATRLIGHLSGLRQGRREMEEFVKEFNAVVLRAESGIKNLKLTARDSGNDLEKLLEKAVSMRDELQFIVASADKIAARLSQDASSIRPPEKAPQAKADTGVTVTQFAGKKPPAEGISAAQASRAERELMQALEKLG